MMMMIIVRVSMKYFFLLLIVFFNNLVYRTKDAMNRYQQKNAQIAYIFIDICEILYHVALDDEVLIFLNILR